MTTFSLLRSAAVCFALLVALLSGRSQAQVVEAETTTPIVPAANDHTTVYRVDPNTILAPVPLNELRLGLVYYHFNPRLNRRVWSIYLGNGQFWHAFGEGSIEPVRMFDVLGDNSHGKFSYEQLMDRLRKLDPELAKYISSTGDQVFLMLNAEGRWRVIGRSSVPRIFDAETGVEWEAQFGRYIPVIHSAAAWRAQHAGCCGGY